MHVSQPTLNPTPTPSVLSQRHCCSRPCSSADPSRSPCGLRRSPRDHSGRAPDWRPTPAAAPAPTKNGGVVVCCFADSLGGDYFHIRGPAKLFINNYYTGHSRIKVIVFGVSLYRFTACANIYLLRTHVDATLLSWLVVWLAVACIMFFSHNGLYF